VTAAHPRASAFIRGIFALFLIALGSPLGAQVRPNDRWRTIRTEHFRVHFTPELEELARRAGANAEEAYAALSRELRAPRGPIDIVVADNVDYTNGSATMFPSNRIVVYASPPVDVASLRLYTDWNKLVVTHELTHIFHLDRTRGWWRAAQYVFGRSPLLFPNAYAPSWITEGLAVYYETRLTGSGRLAGTYHAMVARAGVQGGSLLRIDELSLATPRFPGGDVAYGYGALLIDFLGRTRGSENVPRFVERMSAQPVPFFYDIAARRSFGVTLQRGWREWRDSLVQAESRSRANGAVAEPLPGWRELTRAGRWAFYPRWEGPGRLVYTASTGREVPGAYALDVAAGPTDRGRRIGRRNGTDTPNAPLPGGGLLYAQLDYIDPYTLRGDLYIQRDGRERAITRGARLSSPDARASDGAIVAVQSAPSTTRLVRVSPEGRSIAPLTSTSPDTQWAEPRWSPTGDRVAAMRWSRGGRFDVVVLDTAGRLLRTVAGSGMVESAPSWSPDGRAIYFASDRSGTSQIYVVSADSAEGAATPWRLSGAPAGIYQPALSPDGRTLAASLFRADGFHIGVAPLESVGLTGEARAAATDSVPRRARPELGAAARAAGAVTGYSPWRTLLPRYWLPVATITERDDYAFGAITSGRDVIGRHSYAAQLATPPSRADELDGFFSYSYAGLGRPVLGGSVSQTWDYALAPVGGIILRHPVTGRADTLRALTQRERTGALSALFERPRMRTYSYVSVGGERTTYTITETEPARALATTHAVAGRQSAVNSVFEGIGWSNTQRPELSFSPEDGVSLSGSFRQRWVEGQGSTPLHRVIGVARGYKSLDLPGYAHHVLAARVAAGFASEKEADDFDVGGVSGSSLEVVPGYTIGTSSRSFGVRGYGAGFISGNRAAAASLEYRAPLLLPARGYPYLPLFFSRTSLTVFGDAGTAWCLTGFDPATGDRFCALNRPRRTIASAGAELNLDAALQYDFTYRFRLGVAAPLSGSGVSGRPSPSLYFTLGSSF
jgi:hypothetical protein